MEYIHKNKYCYGIVDDSQLTSIWDDQSTKFIKLTDKMIEFRESNKTATPMEVFNCKLTEATLSEEIDIVLNSIDEYDVSTNVNQFTINGLGIWKLPSERIQLKNAINVVKNSGGTTYDLCIDGYGILTMGVDAAISILDQVEVYAVECFKVTFQHRLDVKALTDIDSVKSYDITQGYPSKLEFTV